MKHACMSNCKDPENRGKKQCCCGGHSSKAKKPKEKKHHADKPTLHMENMEAWERIRGPLDRESEE